MKCKILSNVFLKDRRFLLEIEMPRGFKHASPGQFLHIRVEDSCDPLLRRPLSIHDCLFLKGKKGLVVRVLYEAVGKGTMLLSEKKAFSEIDCLGPLGTGFDLKKLEKCRSIYVVAGGMGVAPLFFLARKISEQKVKNLKREIIVLIGARSKNDILREKDFKDLGCKVHVATEDGSKGFKGRVTELLANLVAASTDRQLSAICSCGPKPMLAAVTDIARNSGIPAQVSLEEFMGCGVGACLGCVIRTASGYKRICHDGPVFDAFEVVWME